MFQMKTFIRSRLPTLVRPIDCSYDRGMRTSTVYCSVRILYCEIWKLTRPVYVSNWEFFFVLKLYPPSKRQRRIFNKKCGNKDGILQAKVYLSFLKLYQEQLHILQLLLSPMKSLGVGIDPICIDDGRMELTWPTECILKGRWLKRMEPNLIYSKCGSRINRHSQKVSHH